MKRFKSPRQVQRFLSIHDPINNLVHLRRDHRPASEYRAARDQAFAAWAEVAARPWPRNHSVHRAFTRAQEVTRSAILAACYCPMRSRTFTRQGW